MSVATESRRASAIRQLLRDEEAPRVADTKNEGLFRALGKLIADASVERDENALRAAVDALAERASKGGPTRDRLLGLLDVAAAAHAVSVPSTAVRTLEPGTVPARFLAAVETGEAVTSSDLQTALGVDEQQISRAGRRLQADGLILKRRFGRRVAWELTPAGRDALSITMMGGMQSGGGGTGARRSPLNAEEQKTLALSYEGISQIACRALAETEQAHFNIVSLNEGLHAGLFERIVCLATPGRGLRELMPDLASFRAILDFAEEPQIQATLRESVLEAHVGLREPQG